MAPVSTDGRIHLQVNISKMIFKLVTHLGVCPDQSNLPGLGDEAAEAVPVLQSAGLVQGVVAQPPGLRALLELSVAIGGHDVPGLQELD